MPQLPGWVGGTILGYVPRGFSEGLRQDWAPADHLPINVHLLAFLLSLLISLLPQFSEITSQMNSLNPNLGPRFLLMSGPKLRQIPEILCRFLFGVVNARRAFINFSKGSKTLKRPRADNPFPQDQLILSWNPDAKNWVPLQSLTSTSHLRVSGGCCAVLPGPPVRTGGPPSSAAGKLVGWWLSCQPSPGIAFSWREPHHPRFCAIPRGYFHPGAGWCGQGPRSLVPTQDSSCRARPAPDPPWGWLKPLWRLHYSPVSVPFCQQGSVLRAFSNQLPAFQFPNESLILGDPDLWPPGDHFCLLSFLTHPYAITRSLDQNLNLVWNISWMHPCSPAPFQWSLSS